MSLKDLTLKSGETYTPSAGTAYDVANGGGDLNKHRVLINYTGGLVLQKKLDFTVVPPRPLASAPNGYTQGRRQIFIRAPMLLANGLYTTNTVTIEIAADIEASDVTMLILRELIIQSALNSDTDGFWYDLSVA